MLTSATACYFTKTGIRHRLTVSSPGRHHPNSDLRYGERLVDTIYQIVDGATTNGAPLPPRFSAHPGFTGMLFARSPVNPALPPASVRPGRIGPLALHLRRQPQRLDQTFRPVLGW